MGTSGGSGAVSGAIEKLRGPLAGSAGGSKGSSSNSSSGVLDVCSSIAEYIVQLHAAAPSLCPVPCGSFFTFRTALKDLTDCVSISGSSAGSASSSTMARDLFLAVTQRQPESDLGSFKAFAKTFHAAATERLAAAKTCSVCAGIRQHHQQQQQENDGEEWGLCLLPHLVPSEQIKLYGLPQVGHLLLLNAAADCISVFLLIAAAVLASCLAAVQVVCGRCLGVLWLSRLLAAAAANVSGDPQAPATGRESLTAALEHFIAVNSTGEGPRGPLWFCRSGTNSRKGHRQKEEATDSSTFKDLPSEAQRRALDVSTAAAFSIHFLAK